MKIRYPKLKDMFSSQFFSWDVRDDGCLEYTLGNREAEEYEMIHEWKINLTDAQWEALEKVHVVQSENWYWAEKTR